MIVIKEILLGSAMLIAIMIVHGYGMNLVMRLFEARGLEVARHAGEWRRQAFFGRLVAMMLATHLAEIMMWGALLWHFGALPDLRTAFYFAGETYTTLGLGDVLLESQWRQLNTFISISGVFAFGWTTGILVKIVDKFYEVRLAGHR